MSLQSVESVIVHDQIAAVYSRYVQNVTKVHYIVEKSDVFFVQQVQSGQIGSCRNEHVSYVSLEADIGPSEHLDI
jgi:hypothetical protein